MRHTHFKKDYQYRQQEKENFIESIESYELFYSTYYTNLEVKDIWYLDSGCSNHITSNKSYFVKLEENMNSEVALGDCKVQKVEGKSTLAIRTKDGQQRFINDVLYVFEYNTKSAKH